MRVNHTNDDKARRPVHLMEFYSDTRSACGGADLDNTKTAHTIYKGYVTCKRCRAHILRLAERGTVIGE